jgi:hypothetical protein
LYILEGGNTAENAKDAKKGFEDEKMTLGDMV